MSETRPRKAGCENCRARHMKCEGGLPCVRCNRRGLDCNKVPPTRFRQASIPGHAQFEFPAQQVWCNTSARKLDFVDQTLETTRYYDDGYQSDDNFESSPRSIPSDPLHEQERTPSLYASGVGDVGSFLQDVGVDKPLENSNRSQADTNAHLPVRPSGESLPNSTGRSHTDDDRSQGVPHLIPDVSYGSVSHCGELYEDAATRKTLRSFVESVGPSIDPCDQYAGLAVEIVERSLIHPQLLPPVIYLGDKQHLNAASTSRTSLGVNDPAFDGVNTLVSAFLFRLIDNLRGLAIDSSSFAYTKPIREALDNMDLYPEEESRLIHQLIWASLRQDLFIAITNHEMACVNVDMETLRKLRSVSDDEEWTNRIFLQLINAVQYCFGDTKSSAVYDQLVDDLALWMQSKPTWFTPIFFQPPHEGQMFPEIWLMNDFAAVASQYYHVVRILLIAHNPRMPRLGPAKRAAAKWTDDQVKSDVRNVCGIAVSRESVDPTHLTACMAIAMAGDRFTDPRERAFLLDILVKTQHRYGWSTLAAQNYLKDSWEISTRG